MAHQKDEAIVLFKRAFGESDKIIRLFTLGNGKVAAIAKGAGRSQKRFMNTLEPFNRIGVEYFEKGGRGLVRLENADLLETNSGIEKSLRRVCTAGFLTEFVDRLTKERERHPGLFETLREALSTLKERELSFTETLSYQLRMLEEAGYLPNFVTCVACGSDVTEEARTFFSRERGGIVCRRCSTTVPARRYSSGAICLLAGLGFRNPSCCDDLFVEEARHLMENFVSFHLEFECKSYQILKRILYR